jgi:ABC-type spermidine/putrescine transport system permease subunit II
MFGKMSSGTNPTIYALSGAILGASIICVFLVLLSQGSKGRHRV